MPDMNLTTPEGALVAVDALVKALKEVHWGRVACVKNDYGRTGTCEICTLIRTIESLPKETPHAPNP